MTSYVVREMMIPEEIIEKAVGALRSVSLDPKDGISVRAAKSVLTAVLPDLQEEWLREMMEPTPDMLKRFWSLCLAAPFSEIVNSNKLQWIAVVKSYAKEKGLKLDA